MKSKRWTARIRDWMLYRLASKADVRIIGGNWPLQRIGTFEVLGGLLRDVGAPLVIDGGAHEGETVEELLRIAPGAIIHAFEPNPAARAHLHAKASAAAFQRRVHVHDCALSNRGGEDILHIGADDQTSSLKSTNVAECGALATAMEQTQSLTVRTITIDQWRRDNDIDALHLIKLDLQGAELDALRGAKETLRDTMPVVLAEVQFAPLYDIGSDAVDLMLYMREAGFKLFGIYNVFHDGQGQCLQADIIWLPARSAKPFC